MSGWVGKIAMLGVLSSFAAASTSAGEITIEPRLSSGVSYYNLDLDGRVIVAEDSIDNIEFNDWLLFIGGGTTISYDRFFVDLSGQYSFSGEDNVGLDVVSGELAVENLSQEVDFDRLETAIAIGYRVTDQFAAYVGYRYADVEFDGTGSLDGIGVDFSIDFQQRGPLIGASYVIPKTILNGALVANGAITFLEGDLDNELDVPAPLDNVNFDIEGDAVGLNAGVSWATPLSNRLKLVVGGDVSSYRFEDDDDETDFDELIVRLRAELRYGFDAGSLLGN
ncbi:MAG: hypothetical protein ACR2RF_23700 [Geminicoccaceae bacterium]